MFPPCSTPHTLPMLPPQELGQKASEEQLAAHAVKAVLVGAKQQLKMGVKGGQTPNTVIFKTDKYRIAYCETNPGRCRYLSLLIPSAICLKDPAGFIALSFGRPSVFD